jgi:acetolactate synthase-1/2/3 large subunit
MAMELKVMAISTQKYRTTDISGNYAELARSLGGYAERITEPSNIQPALKRAIAKVNDGVPTLLEFITSKETATSRHGKGYLPPAPMPRI